MTANDPLSPIRLQLMWDRLIAVVEEQALALIRTGFSTSTREAGDLSAGVFDLDGAMLAQAVTGTPGHINSMARSVRHFLDKFPIGALMEKGLQLRTGQTHVQRFTADLLGKIEEGEIDTTFLISHRLPLEEAPEGYRNFRDNQNEWTKVVLRTGH